MRSYLKNVLCLVCFTVVSIFASNRYAVADDSNRASRAEINSHSDCYGDSLPDNAIARLGTVRMHNPEDIHTLFFSRSGKSLFAAVRSSERGNVNSELPTQSVFNWDSNTGKLIRSIGAPKVPINGMFLSSDDKTLVLSDYRGYFLYSAMAGSFQRKLNLGTGKKSLGILASFDGKIVALASEKDGEIQIWNAQTRKRRNIFYIGRPDSSVLHLSSDGSILALKRLDGTIRIWDTIVGRQLCQFVHKCPSHIAFKPMHVAISPDAKVIGLEGERETIQFYDTRSGKLVEKVRNFILRSGSCEGIPPFEFSPDNRFLAIATKDQSIRVCDLGADKTRWVYTGCGEGAWSTFAFTHDGNTLAAGNCFGWMRMWNLLTGTESPSFACHRREITSIAYTCNDRIVSTSFDGSVRLWNANTGREIKNLHRASANNGIETVEVSPRGDLIAACDDCGTIYLYELPSGKLIRTIRTHSISHLLRFSSDGKQLATDGDELNIDIWDIPSGRKGAEYKLSSKNGRLMSLFFTPKGKLIGTIGILGKKGSVEIQDVKSGKLIQRSETPDELSFLPIHVSADLECLIPVSNDSSLRIMDVPNGREVFRYDFDTEKFTTISAIDLSPDGRFFASSELNADGILLRIWEMASGKEIRRLRGHSEEIVAIAFSPDGCTISTGSRDCTILVWNVFDNLQSRADLLPEPLVQLMEDLSSSSPATAYRSASKLVKTPVQSIDFFNRNLRPVLRLSPERINQLIAELDSDTFSERESASLELLQLGRSVEPALRKALTKSPTLECRHRIDILLKNMPDFTVKHPELLRILRSIWVLQRIGTPEARSLLEKLASGESAARQTQEAKAALRLLDRMKQR